MTRLILFDTPADAVGVVEVVSQLSTLDGVQSFEVLEASAPPRFCVLVETDDAADAAIAERIDSFFERYAAYVSRVQHLAFRKVSGWEDEE
jgi:hypothetical protein